MHTPKVQESREADWKNEEAASCSLQFWFSLGKLSLSLFPYHCPDSTPWDALDVSPACEHYSLLFHKVQHRLCTKLCLPFPKQIFSLKQRPFPWFIKFLTHNLPECTSYYTVITSYDIYTHWWTHWYLYSRFILPCTYSTTYKKDFKIFCYEIAGIC